MLYHFFNSNMHIETVSSKINPKGMNLGQIINAINNKYHKRCISLASDLPAFKKEKADHLVLTENILKTSKVFIWQNESKYYCAYAQKTLFNELCIIKEWGKFRSHLGNCKTFYYCSQKEVLASIVETNKRRLKRGYKLIRCL